MLHDLDSTLEKIIYERGYLNRAEIDISFELPNGEWSARLSRPTLNLFAYDLRENIKLRNMEMRVTMMENGNARRRLAPRRYDVSYVVTAWARKIEDQHQLLWRALGALLQVPILSPHACEGALREQPYDMPLTVANMQDHPINLVDLWSVLDNQMRLGFIAVVTLALDPALGFDSPLVLAKHIRVGQAEHPEREQLDALDVEIEQTADDEKKKRR